MAAERARPPLSAVVTTCNNADTLVKCVASLGFADELLVLDSGSSDSSREIAEAHGATVHVQAFRGYGPQKAAAIALARHDWILLLDADEWLPAASAAVLEQALARASRQGIQGYRLPRIEWLFWRYQHPASRPNTYLRLFDRRHYRMSASVIHAAPEVGGPVQTLSDAPFFHDGERDLDTKVRKINAYAEGLKHERPGMPLWQLRLRMVAYPPWYFVRSYLLKRQFLNGWAGFVNAVVLAFYAFLKDAKRHEARMKNAPS
jgi:glycosyltransferase involved in cell wall biosynthesis